METRRHLYLLALAASSLAFFIYLSSELRDSSLGSPELVDRMDLAAFESADWFAGPHVTRIVIAITHLGSVRFLTLLVTSVAAVFVWRRHFLSAAILIASGLAAASATSLLKPHFARDRPDPLLHLVHAHGHSFPSGHTLAATVVYCTLAILVTRQTKGTLARWAIAALGALLIAAVGFSRVYLHVHYFSDVVGGACMGIAIAALLEALRNARSRPILRKQN